MSGWNGISISCGAMTAKMKIKSWAVLSMNLIVKLLLGKEIGCTLENGVLPLLEVPLLTTETSSSNSLQELSKPLTKLIQGGLTGHGEKVGMRVVLTNGLLEHSSEMVPSHSNLLWKVGLKMRLPKKKLKLLSFFSDDKPTTYLVILKPT